MNNKNFRQRGPERGPPLFFHEVNIVVLIDFIAMLLTPGIFLIQIVNTNNTNMYLIHLFKKILLNVFSQKLCFKVSKPIRHLLSIVTM